MLNLVLKEILNMKTSNRGFTLIELLVVVAIIAILTLMVFPSLGKLRERAKIGRAKTDMQALASAIMAYQTEYLAWPQDDDAVHAVDSDFYDTMAGVVPANPKNPREILFMPRPPGKGKDPWANDYSYQCDYDGNKTVGTNTDCRIAIYSKGPDGADATDDDIVVTK